MASLHFGVHCPECQVAEVEEIPVTWIAWEPAQIILLLSQGVGIQDAEDCMQAAENITDFLEVHESHGAKPVTLTMSEMFRED